MRLERCVVVAASLSLACGPVEVFGALPELEVCEVQELSRWAGPEAPAMVLSGGEILLFRDGADWHLTWLRTDTGELLREADATSLGLDAFVASTIAAGGPTLGGATEGSGGAQLVRIGSSGSLEWTRALPKEPERLFTVGSGVAVVDAERYVTRYDSSGQVFFGLQAPMGTVLDVEARPSGVTKVLGTELGSGGGRPGTADYTAMGMLTALTWQSLDGDYRWHAGRVLDSFVLFAASESIDELDTRPALLQLGFLGDPREWAVDLRGRPLAIGEDEEVPHVLLSEEREEGQQFVRLAAFDEQLNVTRWCEYEADAVSEAVSSPAVVSRSGNAYFYAQTREDGDVAETRLLRLSLPLTP